MKGLDDKLKLTKKEFRRLSHLKAQELHIKGLIFGSLIYSIPQFLFAIFGVLNLFSFVISSILFLVGQAGIYIFAYKVAKQIVYLELIEKLIKENDSEWYM